MAILVMRPFPDNQATASALRTAGYEALLSPALRFEPVAIRDEPNVHYDAVIVTSANALRGVEGHALLNRLRDTKVFAVGDATAQAARAVGLTDVESASGDAVALCALVEKRLRGSGHICYLAGADLSRDLGTDLGTRGYAVTTFTTYRMAPLSRFAEGVEAAFAAGDIEAVLHYSRRSAQSFVGAVQAAGLEISALAVPQCCISDGVAVVLRDAGASRVLAAATPDESGVFEVLHRAIPLERRAVKSGKG